MTKTPKNLDSQPKRRLSDQEKIEHLFAMEREFQQKMRQKNRNIDLWKTEMADLGWL